MKTIIRLALFGGGVLFFGSLLCHYVPSVQNTAFVVKGQPISFYLMVLISMGILVLWASSGKKGRR